MSQPDEGSADEERWITIGLDHRGTLVLVVHTHVEISDELVYIRILSARTPTKRVKGQYEQAPQRD